MKNILNVVNFVRENDPRYTFSLSEVVENQLALIDKHGLKATFLLQYDALVSPVYRKMFEGRQNIELGCWLEVCKPLTDYCGMPWKGPADATWDWKNAGTGFMPGYTRDERKRLIDGYMLSFREIYGRYPASVGSWGIDAFSLKYLKDKYDIKASCNCRDQFGTDGFTLVGGYYSQAYYPSVNNMFCPANSAEDQINVPVFRMLGSDPLSQYDIDMDENFEHGALQTGVCTMEPSWHDEILGGGGNPKWVDWFMDMNYSNALGFSYAQVGQENSFGWDNMKTALTYQFELFEKLRREGKVEDMTLEECGEWFSEKYKLTPATTVVAENDWKNSGKSGIWYENRFYRVNLYCEDGILRIRDIYIFDSDYKERYPDGGCGKAFVYDNLPVIDGFLMSGNGVRAGIYPAGVTCNGWTHEYRGDDCIVTADCSCGKITFELTERGIEITGDVEWRMRGKLDHIRKVGGGELHCEHNGYSYSLKASGCELRGNEVIFVPDNGKIKISVR